MWIRIMWIKNAEIANKKIAKAWLTVHKRTGDMDREAQCTHAFRFYTRKQYRRND